MTSTTKILLIGGGAALVGGILYRQGINNLQFSIDNYLPGPDGTLQVRLRVFNPNRFFGYPVPRVFVVAYDSHQNMIGTIVNNQMQWINANGTSFIYGTVTPQWQNLVSIISCVGALFQIVTLFLDSN